MSDAAASITVRVPLTIRRRPGRKTVAMPVRSSAEAGLATGAEPALLRALARAFRYQRLLDEGRYVGISEMAEGERIERGHLGTLLRLTLLAAPDIVEGILDGRQPDGRELPRPMEPFLADRAEQRALRSGSHATASARTTT
jgi:hypothetical protein